MKWKLTVRNGSEVSHEQFDDLDEAVARVRERALEIRSLGPLKEASMIRDYKPADQVRARLQLAGKGRWGRRPSAGVDVRGDGAFVPFSGGMVREELDPSGHETPFDLVRETLERR